MKKNEKSIRIEIASGIFSMDNRQKIPELPGVYIYKNAHNEILYIGKAKNLRKRVASYFNKKLSQIKTFFLMQELSVIDIIIVENEQDALFLEITLIKKHLPKFNINFKDGKFYPYLKLTIKDKFARILITRNKIPDGNIYFGPYVSASVVRTILEILQKIFQLRTCSKLPKKACLEYHMQRCSAPCINKISSEDYQDQVKKIIIFLSGNPDSLIKDLTKKMKLASDELLFEKAQIYKEQIDALRSLEEKQHIYMESEENIDIIGIHKNHERGSIVVAQVRKGRLVGKEGFIVDIPTVTSFSSENILAEFLLQYYKKKENTSVALSEKFSSMKSFVEDWLQEDKTKIKLKIIGNKDKELLDLLKMIEKNAELHLSQISEEPKFLEILSTLQERLDLKNFPSLIEGFDIAKLDGTLASGVMVQFQCGQANNKEYRMFEIQTQNQQDDYEGIRELIYRRYSKITAKKNLPQLIIIDGGRGQLNAALESLQSLNLDIDIVSIAKQNELIFHPKHSSEIILEKNSPVLHMIQRIRDESHRFSQYYLHKRMKKKLKS